MGVGGQRAVHEEFPEPLFYIGHGQDAHPGLCQNHVRVAQNGKSMNVCPPIRRVVIQEGNWSESHVCIRTKYLQQIAAVGTGTVNSHRHAKHIGCKQDVFDGPPDYGHKNERSG